MRDDDLSLMLRVVLRPDGAAGLLGWLARRLDARVVLVDAAGQPVRAFPDCPAEVLPEVAGDIRRVISGGCAAASICGPSWWARLAGLGGDRGGPALLVTGGAPLAPDDGVLIGHAAALLRLRWPAEVCAEAVAQIREAVLLLLMAGQVSAARRVAEVMKPALAGVIRVYLIEGPAAARNMVAGVCEVAWAGRAWIVRCPVYRRHVIILSPVGDGPGPEEKVFRSVRTAGVDVAIGAGDAVPLCDTAAGYEQAYHALAVARHHPGRCARFTAASDLAAVLGPGAQPWARRTLSPLLDYKPARPQHPDSAQLRATLRSWLDFHAAAWRQLKIHRNTLLERIRHIQAILGRDLSRLPAQAELHLALRLLDRPGPDNPTAAPRLDDLLTAPAARRWAHLMLAPLAAEPPLLATVRAWLAADARPEPAAATLGISARGVHRRLARAEQHLGRCLLGGPSARYDLLLALRIHNSPPPSRR